MAPSSDSGTPGQDRPSDALPDEGDWTAMVRRAATGPSSGSATGSRTPASWTRPWPTGRGAPSSRNAPPTSGSSSWATPCWAWWWPSTPSGTTRSCPTGPCPRCGPRWSTPGSWPRWPSRSGSPTTSGWAGERTSREGGPRSRSWPMPPRPSSAPSTSTGDWPRPSGVILSLLKGRITLAVGEPGESDHKSRLQELTVRLGRGVPHYDVQGSGPDHARRYLATVYVAGQRLGTGEGRSKKDAEQMAAQVACGSLEVERGGGNA